MTLLEKHLEQIELCSSTIAELPFPRPKMFTNAMLYNSDITALIRDTEDHERALFSLAPKSEATQSSSHSEAASRRVTTIHAQDTGLDQLRFRAPRKGTAVASVLGGDLNERIRREYVRDTSESQRDRKQDKDNLDVELLLKGAERLCGVYPVPGAVERIAALRSRNAKVMELMEKYEALVAEQSQELGRMNKSDSFDFEQVSAVQSSKAQTQEPRESDVPMTEDELKREEEGIAELEKRKQVLEERVTGMEKDLGGLMR